MRNKKSPDALQLAEEKITAASAKSMLDRDLLTRATRVAEGKGLLPETDRKRLRNVVRIAQRRAKAAKTRGQLRTSHPKGWEGTFNQKQRRFAVYMGRMQGKTVREIAEDVGADKDTVVRDLRAIEDALNRTLDPKQADAVLNELLLDLESLRWLAISGAAESEGNERVGCLNTAAAVTEQKVRLLQDAGVLRKAPTSLRHAGPDGQALPTAPRELLVTVSRSTERHQYETGKAEDADDE